jgi:hypothetical protein
MSGEAAVCDGHIVELPDESTWNGYPLCPCKDGGPETDLCDKCSALVLLVEAQRPCPDGGMHYEGVCAHYDGKLNHDFPAAVVGGEQHGK